MISPSYFLSLAEGSEYIAEQLHSAIIKKLVEAITLRIGENKNYILTAKDKYMLEALEDSGILREELQRRRTAENRVKDNWIQ